MRSFITGGAGFIGSHLIDKLVQLGSVTIYDNLSAGKYSNIAKYIENKQISFIRADVLDLKTLKMAMKGHDIVFHLAASTDIQFGGNNVYRDIEQGTLATYNVLESTVACGIDRFMFSSSGTVYGNVSEPCNEGNLQRLPISFYGANKLAAEALISAYTENFGLNSFICRFGNVVGPHLTHGVMFDFCSQLKKHPNYLNVLGNGKQIKPYLHISDCVNGILHVVNNANGKKYPAIYNIAPSSGTRVEDIAKMCVQISPNKDAQITYGTEETGWLGDIAISRHNTEKLERLGFKVSLTSNQAAQKAIEEIAKEVF